MAADAQGAGRWTARLRGAWTGGDPRAAAVLAFGAALAIRLGHLAVAGARLGQDSPSYQASCQLLASDPAALWGATPGVAYLGFLAPFCSFAALPGATLQGWVVVQAVASAAGVACLYLAGRRLGGHRAGLVAAAALALLWETFRWDAYLLSDSLFVTALAVALWRLALRQDGAGRTGWLALGLGWLAVARPVGLLLVGAWLAAEAAAPAGLAPRLTGSRLRAAAGLGLLAAAFPLLSGTLEGSGALHVWNDGVLVWGDPAFRYPFALEPGSGLLDFIVRNPLHFLALCALKALLLFLPVAPRFSLAHNALNLAQLLPLYAAAGVGAWRAWRSRSPAALLCLAAVAAVAAGVAANSVDYDWRYRAPLAPPLAILAGLAFARRPPSPALTS